MFLSKNINYIKILFFVLLIPLLTSATLPRTIPTSSNHIENRTPKIKSTKTKKTAKIKKNKSDQKKHLQQKRDKAANDVSILGLLSLIFGSVGLLLLLLGLIVFPLFWIGLIFSIPAIILGIISITQNKGDVMGLIGLILGGAIFFIFLILLIIFL